MKKTITSMSSFGTLSVRTIVCSLFLLIFSAKSASACNANFTNNNGCAGDTIWFTPQEWGVYTWDFGDGSCSQNISHDTVCYHVYSTPGTYYVTCFLNIGAEWDYHTNIVTIGTDCFHADFTTTCQGANNISFFNTSVGSTSVLWTFGDLASGANDSSVAMTAYHLYPASGNYTVTLIASNGSLSDTLVQIINVSANCINVTLTTPGIRNCYHDSALFYPSYIGTITSYLWNFGDPASGVHNTSALASPKHLYTAAGVYPVSIIISNGSAADTAYFIETVVDCTCWPGDCNGDGEVNCDDIFPIGMFYGLTGSPRSAASIAFTSQPIGNWGAYPDWMYLQVLGDAKTADCNGDSIINNLDVAAINANYGMSHNSHNNRSAMPEATVADPAMYIAFSSGSAVGGSTITGTIYLGTAAIPVANLYGYSFSVLYNNAMVVPGSMSVDVSSNWLGDASNELTVTHDNYGAGHVDAGLVRFDHVQFLSGYGAIGTFTFQLQYSASGTFHVGIDATAKMLTTVMWPSTASGNQEIFYPMNLAGADLSVTVGINENNIDGRISVSPNPATDIMNVDLNNTEVSEITLINSLGQLVYKNSGEFKNKVVISTSEISEGIYSLSCKTKAGLVVKKISVIK